MLTSTFIHVQGIGQATERRIWDMGAVTWDRYLDLHSTLKLPDGRKALLLPAVEESIARLAAADHAHFARVLPAKEHWRAVGSFGDELAYLDIETTGCGYDDDITVIGLYDGFEMRSFIRGINLDEFPAAVSRFRMLVTFFGSGFDLPFIRRKFPDLHMDQLHIDLCFLLRRLGYTGGLKHIESVLGIRRTPETDGLAGDDAVRLWHAYRQGSDEALELLLMYNREDVVNMRDLLTLGCAGMTKQLAPPITGNEPFL